MKITLVRHGEVVEEYKGKYNGHNDIALSQNGKKQAKELAKKLTERKFDAIYCSDLRRARETLEAFTYKLTPTFSEKLREKSWGRHEGKSFEEIEAEGIKYENFEQWIDALDGEDVSEFRVRVQAFLTQMKNQKKHTDILVVTHSGFIKTLLSIYNECSLEDAFTINFPYASFIEITL